jgi:hypothetical protein
MFNTGLCIIENSRVNQQAYSRAVSAREILSGQVDPPEWSSKLQHTIQRASEEAINLLKQVKERLDQQKKEAEANTNTATL